MTEHTALSKAEDWLQRQPYFNPKEPDMINKVAEATSIIRDLATINADLLEALRLIEKTLKEWRSQPYGVSADGILNLLIDQSEQAIRKAEES